MGKVWTLFLLCALACIASARDFMEEPAHHLAKTLLNPRFRGFPAGDEKEAKKKEECPPSCQLPPPVCPPGCPPPPPPCPPGCPPPCPPGAKDCPKCRPPCEPCCRPTLVCFPGCEPCCWPPPPCPPGCPRRALPKVKPFMPKPNEKPKPCVPAEFPPPGTGIMGFHAENFRSGAGAVGKLISTIRAGFGAPDTPTCSEPTYRKDEPVESEADVPVFPLLPPQRSSRGPSRIAAVSFRRAKRQAMNYYVPLQEFQGKNNIDLDISSLDPALQEKINRELTLKDRQTNYDPENQLKGGNGDAPRKKRVLHVYPSPEVQNADVDPADLLKMKFLIDESPYRSGAQVFEHAVSAAKVVRKKLDKTLYPHQENETKCKGLSGEQKEFCLKYSPKP